MPAGRRRSRAAVCGRALGPVQLTAIGIGVIIGTGIFVLTGEAAGTVAGPAITLSFVTAAIVCFLAGLCYAEFASTVPIAGSAYTFSYASLGELIAWIIGWDLMLELALGASTVASGWSQYFQVVLTSAPWHAHPPAWIFADHHNLVGGGDRAAADGAAVLRDPRLERRQRRDRGDQAGDHPAGDRRRAVVHPHRQLPPVHPAVRLQAGAGRQLGQHAASGPRAPRPARSESAGSSAAPRSCSSRSSASTSSRPTPRRPRSRSATCRSAIFAVADDLRDAVRRRVAGGDRDGQVQPHRREGAAGDRVPVGRPEHDRDDHRLRRAGGHHLGDPRAADGPEPRVLRDEPRPAAAAGVLPRSRSASARRTGRRSSPASSSPRSPFFFPLKTLAELVNIGTLFAFVLVAIGVIVLRRTPARSRAPVPRSRACR